MNDEQARVVAIARAAIATRKGGTTGTANASPVADDQPAPAADRVAGLRAIGKKADAERPDAAQRGAQAAGALAEKLDCFEAETGDFIVMVTNGGRVEAAPLASEQVADAIRTAALDASGKMIGKDAIDTVRSMLRQRAREQPPRPVWKRVAKVADGYMHDMCNAAGDVVHTTAKGVKVEANTREAFRRGRGCGILDSPIIFTSAAPALDGLSPLLEGIPEADRLPFVAAAVEGLRPDTPNPIVVFTGPEGSGKTAAAQRQMQVLDPYKGQPPSARFEPRDLVAAVQGRHVVLLDNCPPRLPAGTEDIAARCCTGGAETQRSFYSNADSVTFDLSAMLVFTGIRNPLRQPDVLDRALVIPVKRPRQYRPDAELWAAYAAKVPEILGALHWLLSLVLKHEGAVAAERASKHRMVSWHITGEIVARAFGHEPGFYTALAAAKRQSTALAYIEGDGFASALVNALRQWGTRAEPAEKLPGWRSWMSAPGWCAVHMGGKVVVMATAKAICTAIGQHCDDWVEKALPTSARATSEALQRVQGAVTRAGIDTRMQSVNGGRNHIWVFVLQPDGAEK